MFSHSFSSSRHLHGLETQKRHILDMCFIKCFSYQGVHEWNRDMKYLAKQERRDFGCCILLWRFLGVFADHVDFELPSLQAYRFSLHLKKKSTSSFTFCFCVFYLAFWWVLTTNHECLLLHNTLYSCWYALNSNDA